MLSINFLLVFLGVTLLTLTEQYFFSDGRKMSLEDIVPAVMVGVLVGAINVFGSYPVFTIWLAPVFLVIMLALMFWVVSWFRRDGASIAELLVAVALVLLFFMTTKSMAYLTAQLITNEFLSSIVVFLPTGFFIGAIAAILADFFAFRRDYEVDDYSEYGYFATWLIAWILIICLAIGAIKWPEMAMFPSRALGADESLEVYEDYGEEKAISVGDDDENAVTNKQKLKDWCYFYNTALQNDEDEDNNFNFGFNPIDSNKSVWDYDADFRERMKWDPALAAAATAWLDANVGTRYLGEFYESCKGDWAKTINLAKERFMYDQLSYYKNLDAFFAFLDSADDVRLEYKDSGLDDQMYMNPYVMDEVPDVIVLVTDDHEGWFLTYVFMIKGSEFDVSFRIDCGYQPTNVEEIMDIKPQPREEIETKPSPKETKGSPKEETKKHKKKDKPTEESKRKKKDGPTEESKRKKKDGPSEPTKPSKPSEPETEPTKPSEPETEPTKPTKPSEPETEPTKPTEPETEPTKPTEPTTEPTKPSQPETEPTKPTEPPTEPTQPTEPPTEPPTKPTTEPETKDKSKGVTVESNDDDGPGPDTNETKKKKSERRSDEEFESYDDYTKEIKDMEEENKKKKKQESKKAEAEEKKESEKKESKAPKKDDNGDSGKDGGDAIDEPTPTKAPAKKDDGEPINTEPAGPWDGPAD